MKLFEDTLEKKKSPETVIAELFREFKEVDAEPPSQYISPSGLNCQVACAWKLQGRPVPVEKESFQSASFAVNGEDRHKRIQEFLSKTEYWVDVEEYIKEKKLPLQVLEKEGYEVLLLSEQYQTRFRCDGMLKIDGVYYVLEIKTERQQANTYRTKADEKHQKQGLSYTLLMNTAGLIWVYEGRDYLEQKCFLQEVQLAEKQYIHKYLSDIVENKNTPEKLERNLKACGYCPYKNYCTMYFKELEKKEYLEQCQKN